MRYLLLFTLLFVGCKKQVDEKSDFEQLMGKGKSHWQYVQTKEDLEQIAFFKKHFIRQQSFNKSIGQQIPRTVHFIWVGPREFPKSSRKNIESWVDLHPDWKFKFWTDRLRALPHPKMEMVEIKEEHFSQGYDNYLESNNYAEKADVLRYEILLNEGGIYVDHDVMCFQSFEPLIQNYQFACGLEPPHKPIGQSSISVCNNIIASIPNHPIMEQCLSKVMNRWNVIQKMYPGDDQDSTIYRVFHRTFCPFDEAVTAGIDTNHYRNIVFPAGFFNRLDGEYAFYANHEYLGTWYKTEDPFETLMRRRLMKMSKKMNKILLICGVSAGVNLVLVLGVAFASIKRRYT